MNIVIPVGGGAAVKAKTGTGSRSGAGAISVTGLGFQPDMVIVYESSAGSTYGIKCIAVGDITAFAWNPNCYTYAGTTAYKVTVNSLDTDGFSATVTGWTGTFSYVWYAYKFT